MAHHPDTQQTGEDPQRLGTWFHNLHLPGGIETAPDHPLGDFPRRKWCRIKDCVPADLGNWRVLDIGCNAGYYSFALAARGADVIGIDVDPRYLAQARWAASQFALDKPPRVLELSVYDLFDDTDLVNHFDLVWFMGVAYHLRHPLLALDVVRSLEPRRLMFQTMTFPDAEAARVPRDVPLDERYRLARAGWPKLAFIEHSVAGDATNWWAGNRACARAMRRSAGFEVLASPEPETSWCRTAALDEAVREELAAVIGAQCAGGRSRG